ncbi:MAG: bifunctional 5,10-methylenetetrahydrofolate dehydrogenase/5,10-methenyltetrahydrofolate cyclohydrolase [Planctomycetota bacterium]
MAALVIDGRALAERIKEETCRQVHALGAQGIEVRLHAILVGAPEAGRIYAHSQEACCTEVGIGYRLHALPVTASEAEIRACLQQLNDNPEVTAIMLHLPLPGGIDTPALQYGIDPYKDVEGVNPANLGLLFYGDPIIAPCTALAVLEILKEAHCEVRGKHVCVIGQGPIAGRPITAALLAQNATVTGCCVDTPDIGTHTLLADIIIAAAGVPRLVRGFHVKPGAVVIDVGIHRVPGELDEHGRPRLVGDVDFEEVKEVASVITPVPGGVGPITVAILARSAVEAARKQHLHRRIAR